MLIEPFETDAEETHEWLDSVDGLVETGGVDRAGHLLRRTLERTRSAHIVAAVLWGLFLQGEMKADTVTTRDVGTASTRISLTPEMFDLAPANRRRAMKKSSLDDDGDGWLHWCRNRRHRLPPPDHTSDQGALLGRNQSTCLWHVAGLIAPCHGTRRSDARGGLRDPGCRSTRFHRDHPGLRNALPRLVLSLHRPCPPEHSAGASSAGTDSVPMRLRSQTPSSLSWPANRPVSVHADHLTIEESP